MKSKHMLATGVMLVLFGGMMVQSSQAAGDPPYTEEFFLSECTLMARGVNDYFLPLLPGYFLQLESEEENDEGETEEFVVRIEVLQQVKKVNGVKCAVVRETEWVDDELVEISWNYMAYCKQHEEIFYFGEDVNIYEDGKVVSHDGAWLAGVNGARPGLLMAGKPLVGSRYFQEIAPGVAMDRGENLDNVATVDTPAGELDLCLLVDETSPLEPGHVSHKAYAPGIGLVMDGDAKLTEYGRGKSGNKK